MTVFARPGSAGALMSYESRYENFIGGEWVAPAQRRYFENLTPVTGQPFCEIPRSDEADVDKALDAAHAAAPGWGKTAPAARAAILNKIADRIDEHRAALAVAEVWDNGKPVRRRWLPTFRWPQTISGISPRRSAPRRARFPRSTRTLSPTTSTSRWEWSARSFRGTSPS
ncbi:hypothetical protein NIIDMKKI_66950 [Mycobacterium kansasii]|uniref:Aldehyde dehydrogenase domain-containing protein n=1 Tax=Mycobacterium kansasii TaxID=1768 RepID=A0A7G1INS2_MYCKA|nr:hypothetical protein NIIDMKKI_66950 [Mycobacterium kansasii]